jgi:broad specificity phosphatase PhoE
LGESTWIKDSSPFWRIYSSDLSRAEKTTRLILQGARVGALLDQEKQREKNTADHLLKLVVRLDARLREVSKGVKQGLPKSLSYKEAYEWHIRQTPYQEIPLLETDDDGWNRMRAFVNDVIRDAVVEAKKIRRQKEEEKECNINDMPSFSGASTIATTESTAATGSNINNPDHPPAYKVLIISHSALLRIFLRRLLGDERLKQHADARFDADGHFLLPNTCVTILEIRARVSSIDDDDDDDDDHTSLSTIRVEPLAESAENVDIVQLTWSDHLARMPEPEMQFANGE